MVENVLKMFAIELKDYVVVQTIYMRYLHIGTHLNAHSKRSLSEKIFQVLMIYFNRIKFVDILCRNAFFKTDKKTRANLIVFLSKHV